MADPDPEDARVLIRRDDESALDHFERLVALRDAVTEAVPEAGRQAHEEGHSWSEVARAGGLGSASAAYWLAGPGRDERRAALRERQARRVAPVESVDLPGVGVTEAARRLGVTPRTVYQRVERGELEAVTAPNGRLRVISPLPDPPVG